MNYWYITDIGYKQLGGLALNSGSVPETENSPSPLRGSEVGDIKQLLLALVCLEWYLESENFSRPKGLKSLMRGVVSVSKASGKMVGRPMH